MSHVEAKILISQKVFLKIFFLGSHMIKAKQKPSNEVDPFVFNVGRAMPQIS